ncbi:MAG: hypothetical protein U0516_04430 [Candidatus Saccharibacteria bacterium]
MDSIKPPKAVSNQVEKPSKKVEVPKTEISEAQDKSARNYIIIMFVVIGLIVVVGGYIIYRLAAEFAYQSNVNRAQDMLLTSLNTKQKNLEQLKPNYEAITAKGTGGISDADRILSAMPITEAYDQLISSLEAMGQQSGVTVTSVTAGSSSGTGGSSASSANSSQSSSQKSNGSGIPFTFTVNVKGSYAAILTFLKKTEQSARVINFNSMTVSGTNGSDLTANITMTTYYQPEANIESTYETLK